MATTNLEEGGQFFESHPEPVPDQAPPQEAQATYPRHPFSVIFHLLFRVLAVACYLFAQYVFTSSGFVTAFIVTVLFLAFDFWTVKNVTGRLLVGLRWWNEVKPDGTNVWLFESLENKAAINPTEQKIFWAALFVTPIAWGVFLVVSIIKLNFNWAVLDGLALALNIANIIGYVKCARDARKKVKQSAVSFLTRTAMDSFT